jgi:glycosyltransferase involved in cell wall biosynthesis
MTAAGKVTFVQGGFAGVGGIESFAVDLLSSLSARNVPTELICWNAAGSNGSPANGELSKGKVKILRTGWRWGCRWGWPDSVMVLRHWKRLANAELLVLGKLPHNRALHRLLSLRKRMILITPYRPSEMWIEERPHPDILNSFESIVVQARVFEDDLRKSGYLGPVFTLPYLPPEARETSAWPETNPLQIGFLGRLVPDKNLEYLIVSFARLRELGTRASERSALQSLAGRLGVTEHVEFHGRIDRSRVAAAIDQCHVFAFSSRTEGQCLAALEILARGRRVLGTPVGAFPDFLRGVLGSIAPLNDPNAFATALKRMAEPVLGGQIAPADIQQAYSKRFQRGQVVEGYMRIFGCTDASQRMLRAL